MNRTIIKVRLVLLVDKRVLLMEQTDENGGKYTLPGGTVERLEFAKKSLIRECREEVGIKLKKNDLDVVHVLHKKKSNEDRITIYFSAIKWRKRVKCLEHKKFRNIQWFSVHSLPNNTSFTVSHVLNQIKMGEFYSHVFGEGKRSFKKWKRKEKKKLKAMKKARKAAMKAQLREVTL